MKNLIWFEDEKFWPCLLAVLDGIMNKQKLKCYSFCILIRSFCCCVFCKLAACVYDGYSEDLVV